MKIAVLLNCHAYPELVVDTLNSLKTWVSDDIAIMIDAAGWDNFSFIHWNNIVFKSLYHGFYKSPYRNITFGLKKIYEIFPDYDWYVYTEYDCLFTSKGYLDDIQNSNEISCYASDIRFGNLSLPLLDKIFGRPIHDYFTMLGCCVFYSGAFIKKLYEMSFYDKLLDNTINLTTGEFPGYDEYAFEESLYPTLVNALGGKVVELGAWRSGKWTNNKYMMRFKPGIDIKELSGDVSIVHPLKNIDNCLVRKHFKQVRKDYLQWNEIVIKEMEVNYSSQKLEYVVCGTGRSGTVYMSAFFNSLGISCGHERIFTSSGCSYKNYGYNSDASGWAGVKQVSDPFIPLMAESSYLAAPFLLDDFLYGTSVIHVVRNPLDVINSFVNGLNYFKYGKNEPENVYEKFIIKYLPELGDIIDPLLKAAYYYIKWNEMIEQSQQTRLYLRYCIENDIGKLTSLLGKNVDYGYYGNKKCNSIINKNSLKFGDMPESGIKSDLIKMFKRYYL